MRKSIIVIIAGVGLAFLTSCTVVTVQKDGVIVRYGQLFQHKKLEYNTKTGVFKYSTRPEGQEMLVEIYKAGVEAGLAQAIPITTGTL